MVIIYQANVWGSQHNEACDKHAKEAKAPYITKLLGQEERMVFHPLEKKAASSDTLQLAREKLATQNPLLPREMSDMIISQPVVSGMWLV